MAPEQPVSEPTRAAPYSKANTQALIAGSVFAATVFAVLWIVDGRNKALAVFAGIVLVCAGVRLVFGLCCMLDDARKGRFARFDVAITISSGTLLLLIAAFTELPMKGLVGGSVIGGLLVFVLGRFVFR